MSIHDEPLKLRDLQNWLSGEWKMYARRSNTNLLIAVGSHWAKVVDTSTAEPIELYNGNDFSMAIATFNRHAR